jgi:hypothetical protein
MRYALGLAIWLLATSGLFAADQTKSKTSPDQPQPLQMGILIGGKSWDMADTYPDKARKNSQKAELNAPSNEPIIGFLLTDPNNYGLQYTCSYRDTLLYNKKTETVPAGTPCPNVPHNTQSLYIESLKVEFAAKTTDASGTASAAGATGNIKISCRLFDISTGVMTLSDTDPPTLAALPVRPEPAASRPEPPIRPAHAAHPHHYVHAAHRRHGVWHRAHVAYAAPPVPILIPVVILPPVPPAEPPAPTPCATTRATQRIVGVEISLQPPPPPPPPSPPPSLQLGVLLSGNYKDFQLSDSSPDPANGNVPTVKFQTSTDQSISGFFLKHQTQDKSQKLANPFQYSCAYKQDILDGATPPPDPIKGTGTEDKPCPDLAGVNKPVYLSSLAVTDDPSGTIKISCWLYDRNSKATIVTAPATLCTTSDTERIVGIQISLQPPPTLQMGVLLSGKKDFQLSVSSPDKANNNVPTVDFPAGDQPISGFSLKHQTSDENPKVENPFQYSCTYKQGVVAGQAAPLEMSAKADEGKPCPDPAGVTGPVYLTGLDIVDSPKGTIKISCSLYDPKSKAPIVSAPPTACKATDDTQRIVGVHVSVQPPPPPPRPLLQLRILASEKKEWSTTQSFSALTDTGGQTFAAPTPPAHDPIVGVFLRNETPDFGFLYTCVLHDVKQNRNVPITVPAGVSCIGDTSNAEELYVSELTVEPTGNPPAQFTISCTLSDSDKPGRPCKTAPDSSQRIVGVQVDIQLPPLP